MIRALVTGGSGAIGAAICRRLAAGGRRGAVHAKRNLAQAEQVAQAIRAAGGQADALAFDVTDAQAATAALEKLLADGPIQIEGGVLVPPVSVLVGGAAGGSAVADASRPSHGRSGSSAPPAPSTSPPAPR